MTFLPSGSFLRDFLAVFFAVDKAVSLPTLSVRGEGEGCPGDDASAAVLLAGGFSPCAAGAGADSSFGSGRRFGRGAFP